MKHRHLGSSGLQVSAVGLGTNNFGARTGERESIAVVKEAIEQGVTLLDTANSYGSTLSEEYIGKAIAGQRDRVLLATKVSSPVGEGPNQRGASRHHIIQQAEQSLRRLNTDYIDLYQVHHPDPATPIEETLRALDDLVRQGKVRYIGCSNFRAWQVCEAVWTSRSLGLHHFVSVQSQYNLLERGIEREVLPFCQAYGLGIIPYLPLASGFLTGKYRPGQPPPEGARLAGASPMAPRILTEDNFSTIGRLEEFAAHRGHTLLELALAWLLARPQVATVIAGATSPEQVQANVAAAEAWGISPEEAQQAIAIVQGVRD